MARLCIGLALALLPWHAFSTTPSSEASIALPTGQVTQVDREHVVQPGEHLTLLAARFGVAARLIAQRNGLAANARLRTGQHLRIESRHLLADAWHVGQDESLQGAIVINLPQRMAYLVQEGHAVVSYPVAVGRPDWRTPTGEFHVISRERDKTWFVPPSIQAEMRREGKPVLTQVPPGPDNPLGRHWIGLSLPGIGIHGTIAPASIYGFRSHGCIRMQPEHVEALFEQVRLNTPGRIVYQAVLLMQTPDGRIWFEANPDAYRREPVTLAALQARAQAAGVAQRVDWVQVQQMLKERDGQARPIERSPVTQTWRER